MSKSRSVLWVCCQQFVPSPFLGSVSVRQMLGIIKNYKYITMYHHIFLAHPLCHYTSSANTYFATIANGYRWNYEYFPVFNTFDCVCYKSSSGALSRATAVVIRVLMIKLHAFVNAGRPAGVCHSSMLLKFIPFSKWG